MKRQVVWQLGLVVLFLTGIGTARAGVPARETVCWLGTGDWQLREKEGKVYLVVCDWRRASRLPAAERHRWSVSVPTIQSQSGKFLGGDPHDRTPSVSLCKDKGSNTRWTFEFVASFVPRPRPGGEGRHDKVGPSGFRFRAKMAEGRFKNWYLAAEDVTAEQQEGKGKDSVTRRLKLVRDVKDATVFTYIDVNYRGLK